MRRLNSALKSFGPLSFAAFALVSLAAVRVQVADRDLEITLLRASRAEARLQAEAIRGALRDVEARLDRLDESLKDGPDGMPAVRFADLR